MTYKDYTVIQERLSRKLKNHRGYSTNKETAYNQGVLACKSIIKEIFESQLKGNTVSYE